MMTSPSAANPRPTMCERTSDSYDSGSGRLPAGRVAACVAPGMASLEMSARMRSSCAARSSKWKSVVRSHSRLNAVSPHTHEKTQRRRVRRPCSSLNPPSLALPTLPWRPFRVCCPES